jgi:hypothetical protein
LVSPILEDLCSPLSLFVFISVAVSSQIVVLFCSGIGSSPYAGFDSSLLLSVKKKILVASILLLSWSPALGFCLGRLQISRSVITIAKILQSSLFLF